MNCKPGDLAIITRAFFPENIGVVVRVLNERDYSLWNGPLWLTESPRPTRRARVLSGEELSPSRTVFHPDSWMRPIRDPGEDAKDETLSWLPSPSREKESV